MLPDHGDALADLAVALAMQGADNPNKVHEAMDMIEQAKELGASGSSFDTRR